MNGAQILEAILPAWRAALPPTISPAYLDGFLRRNRRQVEAMLERFVARRAARKIDGDVPPEHRTKAQRTKANLAAMDLVAGMGPGQLLTPSERAIVEQYSSWGGLSIEENQHKFPPGLVPDAFSLIHDYFTPRVVAEAIADALCPLLPQLAGLDGVVRALEPSVGIGRLVRAFSPKRCLELEAGGRVRELRWTAVELSPVTARLFAALHPEAEFHHTNFEKYVREHGPAVQNTFNLVVSNPPYGQRGEFAGDDPHPDYRETAAYAYFLRRTLDLLVPGGLGVYIIPRGFIDGAQGRTLRERVLRRHHLSAAFRLPSEDTKGRDLFPGAHNVVDVVFFRARGGELSRLDEADEFIVRGEYFERFPEHVLGREVVGEDVRRRYAVIGDFTGLPPLVERPVCSTCALRNVPRLEEREQEAVTRNIDADVADLDEHLQQAVALGRRFDRYMRLRAADDPAAADLWLELRDALLDIRTLPPLAAVAGNPWRWSDLRRLAGRKDLPAAQQFLNAYTQAGELVPAIAIRPEIRRKYAGPPDDPIAQAEHLFRAQRRLTVDQLLAFHRTEGGTLPRAAIVDALLAADWNLDGEAWDELLPADAYTAGRLWPRHDRARQRAEAGDAQARRQLERLLAAMKLAVFEDIQDISPRQRWLSLDLVSDWLGDTLNRAYGRVPLEVVEGIVQPVSAKYERLYGVELGQSQQAGRVVLSPEALWFLGWLNHDQVLFRPELTEEEKRLAEAEVKIVQDEKAGDNKKDDEEDEAEAERSKLALARLYKAIVWDRSFRQWIEASDERRARITEAYNRAFRGTVIPTFEGMSLSIARWSENAPRLRPHQVQAVLRVVHNRGGGVGLDVGLGKTYVGIASTALARQEGWARRPVVIVPSSIVWKWFDDFRCVLPDYRVVVIGSNRKRLSRGARKGLVTSETDTPEERARKWTDFQAGLYDVALLTYDAMPRTRLNEEAVFAHVEQVAALRRQIKLRQRNAARKDADKLTERDEAILKHGVRAFAREVMTLPEGHKFDPGVAWDTLGVDLMIVDEAAAFKNLYMPEPREHGLPKFMGGSGEGSKRAWQLEFRAAAVRRNTGGTGIILLSATPAKNSPLEFYNLIQLIDPEAFTGRGLMDPEQFIDRFLKIETMEVVDAAFNVQLGSAVTGFKNLDDLRAIVMNYFEFRTGEQVGLKLPKPDVRQVRVPMNALQEEKYTRIVAQIERLMDMAGRGGEVAERVQFKILGLLQRLSQIALHPLLDEGYDFHTALSGGVVEAKQVGPDGEEIVVQRALPPPEYASPKLLACAERVVASPGCGHIIFCEPTAVQVWMREVLVSKGIPRERIAILNAIVAKPADRVRIAREFNGLSGEPPPPGTCGGGQDVRGTPKYDVIIVNVVGQEGIDLQVRTCAIHHLDLTWTPADLEQRNGRAVRQGNTLEVVQIFYYMSDRSMDWYRYALLSGKRGWLVALLDSQVRDTNNPGAQQTLTHEDILLLISRDEAKTRKMLDDRREQRRREGLAKMAREAAMLLSQASARFRDARETRDLLRAAKLRAEGETRLADLERVSVEAWPWARWATAARDVEVLVPQNGRSPVFEGLKMRVPGGVRFFPYAPRPTFLEFGRVLPGEGGPVIGVRAANMGTWKLITGTAVEQIEVSPEDLVAGFDEDAQVVRDLLESHIDEALAGEDAHWRSLELRGASDAWLSRWWPVIEPRVRAALSRPELEHPPLPVVVGEALSLRAGEALREGELLPPTREGWDRFIQLAPTSGEKFTALRAAGDLYFDQKIPRDLLSKEQQAEADSEAASTPEPDEVQEAPARKASTPPAAPSPEDTADAEEQPEEADTPPAPTPSRAAAPTPAARLETLYDEARSAIRALQLPASKFAYYVGQAERAIARGQSYLPVVRRARKAAEKIRAEASSPRKVDAPTARAPSGTRPWEELVTHAFNAEPGPRLEFARRRGQSTLVFTVSPEGGDPADALASIDVEHEEIQDVRWLDDRLSPAVQDQIVERLERAIEAAEREDNPDAALPSPLEGLIKMMRSRGLALGADAAASAKPGRADEYARIAAILQDLSEPTGTTAQDLAQWLVSQSLEAAGDLVEQALVAGDEPLERHLVRLWDEVSDRLSIGEVVPRDGAFRVPAEALFDERGQDATLLVREPLGPGRFGLVRLPVVVKTCELDTEDACLVEDPRRHLVGGEAVYLRDGEHEPDFYQELHDKLRSYEDTIRRAPQRLADVRQLLYWTAAMIEAPRCQGELKKTVLVAFEQAKQYYDLARRRLAEGRDSDAVRRMHEALRRIGTAAAMLAKNCGEGQGELTPPTLGVRPEDAAVFGGEAPASVQPPVIRSAALSPGRAASPVRIHFRRRLF